MNLASCLQLLRDVKDVALATVDKNGLVQNRIIDIALVEEEKAYFCTARGKQIYSQLMDNNHIAIVCLTSDFKMIRLVGCAHKLQDQKKWIDKIFEDNPSMASLYPDECRYILEPFCIDSGEIELFDLGVEPVERQIFSFGNNSVTHNIERAEFHISDECIQCGLCERLCPQKCIHDYQIDIAHCMRCGLCFEQCPVQAIERSE